MGGLVGIMPLSEVFLLYYFYKGNVRFSDFEISLPLPGPPLSATSHSKSPHKMVFVFFSFIRLRPYLLFYLNLF